MKKEYAINLCDILWNYPSVSELGTGYRHGQEEKEASRIYIGSYFCENYFTSLEKYPMQELKAWCEAKGIQITLVVPVSSQHHLKKCKQVIESLCKDFEAIDEICVNDPGMLAYVSLNYEKRFSLGRLFMKEQRDPRNRQLKLQENEAYRWNSQIGKLVSDYGASGIEADAIYTNMDFSDVPEEYVVGIHMPYAYMTTGRMCMFASMNREGALQFMADQECHLECRSKRICFPSENGFFLKAGRAVYYPSVPMQYKAACTIREIYWPCEEK